MSFFPPPQMNTSLYGANRGGFGSGGMGFGSGGGVPGPTGVGSTTKKPGWRQRMGWTDPRIRSILASQIISAGSIQEALGAMFQGPALVAEFEEEERLKKLDEERAKREEEDRALRRQVQEAQLRREEAAQQERRRQARRLDQENAAVRQQKRGFEEDLSKAELGEKIDPGLARILRRMGPEEGGSRLRARLYPTAEEQARLQAVNQGLENQKSIMVDRESRMEQRERQSPKKTDARLLLNDQLRSVGAQIDDLRASAPSPYSDERSVYEAKMAGLEAERSVLRKRQKDLSVGGMQPSSAALVPEGKIVADLAKLPAIGSEDAAMGLVQEWKAEGIYEEVLKHLQEGKDVRTAILQARGTGQ